MTAALMATAGRQTHCGRFVANSGCTGGAWRDAGCRRWATGNAAAGQSITTYQRWRRVWRHAKRKAGALYIPRLP